MATIKDCISEIYTQPFPYFAIDMELFMATRKSGKDYTISTSNVNGVERGFIEIKELQYPQTRANRATSEELEKLYKAKTLVKTGKTFTVFTEKEDSIEQIHVDEYAYKGEYYARVQGPDGKIIKGKEVWIKVEPIKWEIINWARVKSSGDESIFDLCGEDLTLDSMTESFRRKNKDRYRYKRYDYYADNLGFIKEMDHSGMVLLEENNNVVKKLSDNYNVSKLAMEMNNIAKELKNNVAKTKNDGPKTIIQEMNPDITPTSSRKDMTNTEMLKMWVDNGESVLIRGPSGIGKSQRLREMYPDVIELKLTDHMFPETVLGSVNFQEGQLIPPNFAREAIMLCANEEEREMVEDNVSTLYKLADQIYERSKSADGKVVILMDELLNVKPAVQSLVFGIVLNKIVESNGRSLKLPANVVIVATGNQQKFSSSANELSSPLEKRFDHILDMEPRVGEWLMEYAIPRKLHPAVIGYIFSKYQENECSEDMDKMGYFYEDIEVGETHLDKFGSRGKTNDPRGWTAISQILYNFEEDLKQGKFVGMDIERYLQITLSTKLRDEWATDFYNFYNQPMLTIEEVVQKSYDKEALPQTASEKFVTMASLLIADEKQIEECRAFVRKNCPDYLALYDKYWIGNDKKRLKLICDIQVKDYMGNVKNMEHTR